MKNYKIITMIPDNLQQVQRVRLAILVLLQLIAWSYALDTTTFESSSQSSSQSSSHLVPRFPIQNALDLLPTIRGGGTSSPSFHNQTEAAATRTNNNDPRAGQPIQQFNRTPNLDYADILHCTTLGGSLWEEDQSSSSSSSVDDDDDDPNPLEEDPSSPMSRIIKDDDDDQELLLDSEDSDTDFDGSRFLGNDPNNHNNNNNNNKRWHSPVVYRYYGRNRSRGHQDSIPFILLGPNVDHWREVGKILATRGFSVMACERVAQDKDHPIRLDTTTANDDGPNLVLEILDALRWNRAILVGCDKESVLAMETAMDLAPEKVAGLVLCGDLTDANRLASEAGSHGLDAFLRSILDCPFTIVWNGEYGRRAPSHSNNDRVLILGAGTAPHRRKAEQFAWVLTRFVEEKLASLRSKPHVAVARPQQETPSPRPPNRLSRGMSNLNLPLGLESLVTSEGRLVLGRSIATALFYIIMMKVALVQYGMLRGGLIEIKAKYDTVDKLRRTIFKAVGGFIVNYGYIPRLFSFKKAAEDDEDDLLLSSQNIITLKSDKNFQTTDASETDSSNEDVVPDSEDTAVEDSSDETVVHVPDSEDAAVDKGEQEETPYYYNSQRNSANDEDTPEDDEWPIFKPDFFLDHIDHMALVQYNSMLRRGLVEIKAKYDTVDKLRRTIFKAVGAFLVQHIPRLFRLEKAAEDDEDDDVLSSQNTRTFKSGNSQTDPSETDHSSDEGVVLDSEDAAVHDGEKEETPYYDDSQRNSANDEDTPEDDEQRPVFKPYFFLDRVNI
jgi:hypothetical protein